MTQMSNAEASALQARFRTAYFSKYGPNDAIPDIMGWGVGLHKGVLGVKIIARKKRAFRNLPDTFEGLPVHKVLTAGPARLDKSR